ncbi:MAG: hypothetical protein A4E57_04398 [Syntrophorhabdaceae bacterium PtaU1.Bin034]|nr:MAG: hypothetical protein A4E57_04398 [Syntrophorhabdaceae bacterium PtaU1.Bin034]
MEKGYDPVLKLGIHVDQDVPAREEIEAGKGRVLDEILYREDDLLPDVLLDPVAVVFPDEEAAEPLLAHVARDIRGVGAGPRPVHGLGIDVRPEDLHVIPSFLDIKVLIDHHRDRICFLAS